MIVFESVCLDFGRKLTDNFESEFTIVFDFVPQSAFDYILLEVGFGEETDDIGRLDLFELLGDGSQASLTSVTVLVGEAVDGTL